MRIVYGLLLSFVLSAPLEAEGLKWERSIIEKTAEPTDKRVAAEFVFTNTSKRPIRIRKISSSCSCTSAQTEKKVYESGETGKLEVVFTLGGRKGLQDKAVIVASGSSAKDVLLLRVDIPDSVELSAKMLSWDLGAPLTEQRFLLTLRDPETTKIQGIKMKSQEFEAELQELEPGTKYAVAVRPKSTERPSRGSVRVEIEDPKRRSIYLKMAVQP